MLPLNLRQKTKGSAKTPSALLTSGLPMKLGLGDEGGTVCLLGPPWEDGRPSKGLSGPESLLYLHGPIPRPHTSLHGSVLLVLSFVVGDYNPLCDRVPDPLPLVKTALRMGRHWAPVADPQGVHPQG